PPASVRFLCREGFHPSPVPPIPLSPRIAEPSLLRRARIRAACFLPSRPPARNGRPVPAGVSDARPVPPWWRRTPVAWPAQPAQRHLPAAPRGCVLRLSRPSLLPPSPSKQFSGIQQDGDRSVVHQLDFHVRAKHTGLHPHTQGAQLPHEL